MLIHAEVSFLDHGVDGMKLRRMVFRCWKEVSVCTIHCCNRVLTVGGPPYFFSLIQRLRFLNSE
jgi:hypothetical protein